MSRCCSLINHGESGGNVIMCQKCWGVQDVHFLLKVLVWPGTSWYPLKGVLDELWIALKAVSILRTDAIRQSFYRCWGLIYSGAFLSLPVPRLQKSFPTLGNCRNPNRFTGFTWGFCHHCPKFFTLGTLRGGVYCAPSSVICCCNSRILSYAPMP